MAQLNLANPLTFEPIFMERIWGGRKLAQLFGKNLPSSVRIGESWEIVDRLEAQSTVRDGPLKGMTLNALWTNHRTEVFGEMGSPRRPLPDRFPLLIKLLDAEEKLSLQVHPPHEVAKTLGGEPKTEFWYVAAADPGAQLFVGLKESMTREEFKRFLDDGTVADCVHKIPVKAGDAMFLPAGRFHAIGGGNVLVEIQQNSDTTYRVFDWNRVDEKQATRQLHVDEALQCIDFNDAAPDLVRPKGEVLVTNELFEVQKWDLKAAREVAPPGQFAVVFCLTGGVSCAGITIGPGEFMLVPASLTDRLVDQLTSGTSILRVTIPR